MAAKRTSFDKRQNLTAVSCCCVPDANRTSTSTYVRPTFYKLLYYCSRHYSRQNENNIYLQILLVRFIFRFRRENPNEPRASAIFCHTHAKTFLRKNAYYILDYYSCSSPEPTWIYSQKTNMFLHTHAPQKKSKIDDRSRNK